MIIRIVHNFYFFPSCNMRWQLKFFSIAPPAASRQLRKVRAILIIISYYELKVRKCETHIWTSYCLLPSCPEYTDPTVDYFWWFQWTSGTEKLAILEAHVRSKLGPSAAISGTTEAREIGYPEQYSQWKLAIRIHKWQIKLAFRNYTWHMKWAI